MGIITPLDEIIVDSISGFLSKYHSFNVEYIGLSKHLLSGISDVEKRNLKCFGIPVKVINNENFVIFKLKKEFK
jgi:hypothetical protein